jgi:hypothetical protein
VQRELGDNAHHSHVRYEGAGAGICSGISGCISGIIPMNNPPMTA